MASFSKNISIAAQVRRINKQLNAVAARCEGPVEATMFTQAALVASEQRSLAPVDPESDTPGAAKGSIRVERGKATAKKAIVVQIKAGNEKTRKTSKSGHVYDYVRAIEFGTEDMKAQPFFFPIWRARKKEAKAAVRKAIKLAVKDTFK